MDKFISREFIEESINRLFYYSDIQNGLSLQVEVYASEVVFDVQSMLRHG